MIIYVGADHRGYSLKELVKSKLKEGGYSDVVDCGNTKLDEHDDYPDFAAQVARNISNNPSGSRGIVMCGSGAGADIVANKFPNVRSALAISSDQIFDARQDDDVNVLALSADLTNATEAMKIVEVFLGTQFTREERFVRRLEKISRIESDLYK